MKKVLYESENLKGRCAPLVMPFYFASYNQGSGDPPVVSRYFVKISSWDMTHYDTSWMDCEHLPKACLVPDVDITFGFYEFDSENEALLFIKNWWQSQPKETTPKVEKRSASYRDCPKCGGTGHYIGFDPCFECGGSGHKD